MMLGLGCGSAMASESIGANDGGWGSHQKEFTLPANKTLTLNFTVKSTAKNADYEGWVTQVRKGQDMIFFMQPSCGYAVGDWNWASNSAICNENNYDWTEFGEGTVESPKGYNFRENLQGARVVYTLKRVNSEIILTEDVTTTEERENQHFRHYFVYGDENPTDNLTIVFGADNAVIEIDDITVSNVITDSEQFPAITGTVIGAEDNSSTWWTQFSDYFPIEANGSLTLKFKNYGTKVQNYHNWCLAICNDNDRATTDYVEYLVLRSDLWGWNGNQSDKNTNDNSWYTSFDKDHYPSSWYNFREAMYDATVTLTITRFGATVTVDASFNDGEYYTQFVMDCGDGTQTIRAFLCVDHAHLDLLPVTTTIGTYGWATFSSDYALDFSKAAGMTAYKITGHRGNVVTKVEVTGTVPAGTGLLLKGSAGSYNIPIVGSSATDVTDNLLVAGTGASVSAEADKTRYVLGVNGSAAEFQKITSTPATVAKGKAYLQFNEEIAARALSFEDESTGVMAIDKVQPAVDNVYDLSGRKIVNGKSVNGKLQRGLYIVNGKKVVIK